MSPKPSEMIKFGSTFGKLLLFDSSEPFLFIFVVSLMNLCESCWEEEPEVWLAVNRVVPVAFRLRQVGGEIRV
jgi:hypothetical protein